MTAVRFHSRSGRQAAQHSNRKRYLVQYNPNRIGAKSTGHEGNCASCGYPITAVMGSRRTESGTEHVLCPSLSERRRLRAEEFG